MEIAFATDSGGLPTNEDGVAGLEEIGLFAVCDGFSGGKGGAGGGDKASRTALATLGNWGKSHAEIFAKARALNSKMVRGSVQNLLIEAFQECSRAVFAEASAGAGTQNSCTTMDAILFLGTHALVAHVGSGRVYLARNGELHQITEDHTQLAHLRRIGRLNEVPAAQVPVYAKRLMRAVGFREEVQVDVIQVELAAGDRFVSVTDGIWSSFPEEDLEKLLLAPGKPSATLQSLHSRLAGGKAKDNFTTLVIEPQAAAAPAAEASAETKIKMLGTVPAFSFLSYQELIRVINTGELTKLGAGQEIWKEGASGDEMMLVLSGSVEIIKNGKRLNVLKKGDVLGEMSMIDSAPRSATVVTAEATNLLAFPRDALFTLLREEKELAVKFLWGVTMEMNKRLRTASNQLTGSAPQAAAVPGKAALPFHRGKA